MSRVNLDITKTLYDSDGYRHTLVRATPLQILTLVEGFYWLWDRRSGRCLVEGMASHRLSNTRPPGDDLQSGRDPVAETRAFFIAQKAVRTAAASAGAVLAMGGDAGRPPAALADGPTPRALLQAAAQARSHALSRRPRPLLPAPAASSVLTTAVMVGFFALALLLPSSRPDEPRLPALD